MPKNQDGSSPSRQDPIRNKSSTAGSAAVALGGGAPDARRAADRGVLVHDAEVVRPGTGAVVGDAAVAGDPLAGHGLPAVPAGALDVQRAGTGATARPADGSGDRRAALAGSRNRGV